MYRFLSHCLVLGAALSIGHCRDVAACTVPGPATLEFGYPRDGAEQVPTNVVPHFHGGTPTAVGLFDAEGDAIGVSMSVIGLRPLNVGEEVAGKPDPASDTRFLFPVFQLELRQELAPESEYELVVYTGRTTGLGLPDGGVRGEDTDPAELKFLSADGGAGLSPEELFLLGQPERRSVHFTTAAGPDEEAPEPPRDVRLSKTQTAGGFVGACHGRSEICVAGLSAAADVLAELHFSDGSSMDAFANRDTLFYPAVETERQLLRARLTAIDHAGNRSETITLTREDIPHARFSERYIVEDCSTPPLESWSVRDAGSSTPSSKPQVAVAGKMDAGGYADAGGDTEAGVSAVGSDAEQSVGREGVDDSKVGGSCQCSLPGRGDGRWPLPSLGGLLLGLGLCRLRRARSGCGDAR